jgi:hypothetical protein
MWLVLTAAAAFASQVLAADNELTAQEKQAGWILLFDGTSTNDWMTSEWQLCPQAVENGSINPDKCNTYMMTYERPWTDFVLVLDFKISPHTNSGIFVRTFPLKPLPGFDVGYNGVEVQILDSHTAGFYDTGALYDLVKPTLNAMRPVGEWNHVQITCSKSIIDVNLNGEHVNHMDLDQWTRPYERPDGTPHKFKTAFKYHPRTGYIGLQKHGGNAWFKNIKLKPLD